FPIVRMVGQAPFVGYAVADFAPDEEPEPVIDTSLVEQSEEPEVFLAIASERPVDLEPYAVVQLPLEDVSAASSADAQAASDARSAADLHAKLASAQSELEVLRNRQRVETRDADERSARVAALSARNVELERELEEKTGRLKAIEGRAGDTHVRAERLGHE